MYIGSLSIKQIIVSDTQYTVHQWSEEQDEHEKQTLKYMMFGYCKGYQDILPKTPELGRHWIEDSHLSNAGRLSTTTHNIEKMLPMDLRFLSDSKYMENIRGYMLMWH